tara:strand:+ start:4620 stop:4988 length:369 start_codon:yes stop_codon:yes gene_type:complete
MGRVAWLSSDRVLQGDVLKEHSPVAGDGGIELTDIEARIQQIAQVLAQLDDSQVPRNIRASAKESVDQWLLNKDKDMDVRLGMTASKLDEIFNDTNLPIHYGPLCLQIQTALETLMSEVKRS